METRELNIRITLDRRSVFLLLVLFFISWHPGSIGSETLTLTTYYPAPYGGYARLLTTGDTILARNSGGVGIGNPAMPLVDKLTVQASGTAISAIDGGVRTRFFSSASTPSGYVGTSSAHAFRLRTADADRVVITAGGDLQILNGGDITMTTGGYINGLCYLRGYGPSSVTLCDPGDRLFGHYPDGIKRIYGFLPANAWSMQSGVGTYVSMGHDWGGILLCCRMN